MDPVTPDTGLHAPWKLVTEIKTLVKFWSFIGSEVLSAHPLLVILMLSWSYFWWSFALTLCERPFCLLG